MNQPTQIQAEVTPFEYAPGLEAGLRILGMDGKPEFHPRSDSQIYKAYQSRIDYSLVTPFIVYNHMQLPLRPNDRILVKGETVLAVLSVADLASIEVVEDAKENLGE